MNFNKNREKLQKNINGQNLFDVDFSFLLIFAFAFLVGEIWFYCIYIFFLICHEMCHFFVAKKLGYFPKKIKLNFFGAALEGDDDFAEKDEIKIVLAGPFFNFCVIVFCYLCFWFYPESYEFLHQILIANLAIFFFNMLPIFPLDFGRFLLVFLSKHLLRTKAVFLLKKISLLFVCFLFGLGLAATYSGSGISIALGAINLMILTFSSAKDTSYKRHLFAKRKFKLLKKGLVERVIYVDAFAKDYSLFKFVDDNHFVKFVFLDGNLKPVRFLSEIELYQNNNLL